MENNTNWLLFINKILDNRYALDIKKTGSVAMFVENQLSACENGNIETDIFKECLANKIEDLPFSAANSLAYPLTYEIMLDLGAAFLPSRRLFMLRCCSLYVQLVEFNRPLNEASAQHLHSLQIQTSRVIVSFMEEWKNMHGPLGIHNIYQSYGFFRSVVEKWKGQLATEGLLTNPNVLVGLIYMNEWPLMSAEQRKLFIAANIKNTALFSTIISDMQRLEGKIVFDYFSFTKDCKLYFEAFYNAVLKRCRSWAGALAEDRSAQNPVPIEEKQHYIMWANQNAMENTLARDTLESVIEKALQQGNFNKEEKEENEN